MFILEVAYRIDYVEICKYVYICMMQRAYMRMCGILVRSAEENDIEAAHVDTAHIGLLNDSTVVGLVLAS